MYEISWSAYKAIFLLNWPPSFTHKQIHVSFHWHYGGISLAFWQLSYRMTYPDMHRNMMSANPHPYVAGGVLISIKMVPEYTFVNESSDGPQMYWKMLIGGYPSFCKLLSASHHLKNHLGLVTGFLEHCCDIFYHVVTIRLVLMVNQCVCWADFSTGLWLWCLHEAF